MPLLDPVRGVAYEEARAGTPKESLNPRAESRTSRTLKFDWNTRQFDTARWLGYSEKASVKVGMVEYDFIHRETPADHPSWPAGERIPMYASEVSEMVGDIPAGVDENGVGMFKRAIATVGYTSRKYEIRTDEEVFAMLPEEAGGAWNALDAYFLRYVEIVEKPTAAYQSIPPNSGLVWQAGGGRPQLPATLFTYIVQYFVDIKVIWREVPLECYREYMDDDGRMGFMDFVGKSNSAPFGHEASLLGVKPVQTVIQGAPTKELYRMPNGQWAADVTIPYRFHPKGANYFYRHDKPGGPGYDLLQRPDGSLLFPPLDLRVPYVM